MEKADLRRDGSSLPNYRLRIRSGRRVEEPARRFDGYVDALRLRTDSMGFRMVCGPALSEALILVSSWKCSARSTARGARLRGWVNFLLTCFVPILRYNAFLAMGGSCPFLLVSFWLSIDVLMFPASARNRTTLETNFEPSARWDVNSRSKS